MANDGFKKAERDLSKFAVCYNRPCKIQVCYLTWIRNCKSRPRKIPTKWQKPYQIHSGSKRFSTTSPHVFYLKARFV